MGEARRRRAFLEGANEQGRAVAIRAHVHHAYAWWAARQGEKDPVVRVVSQPPAYRNHRYLPPEAVRILGSAAGGGGPAASRHTRGTTSIPWDNPHTCEAKVWRDGRRQVITHSDSLNCRACREHGPPSVIVDSSGVVRLG